MHYASLLLRNVELSLSLSRGLRSLSAAKRGTHTCIIAEHVSMAHWFRLQVATFTLAAFSSTVHTTPLHILPCAAYAGKTGRISC